MTMLNDFWEDVKGLGMVLACSCGVSCQPAGGQTQAESTRYGRRWGGSLIASYSSHVMMDMFRMWPVSPSLNSHHSLSGLSVFVVVCCLCAAIQSLAWPLASVVHCKAGLMNSVGRVSIRRGL